MRILYRCSRQLAEPGRMIDLQGRTGLAYFGGHEYLKAAACWLEYGQLMDEEYRLNLVLLERWALRWAEGVGHQTDKHASARAISRLLCLIYQSWHRAMTPSNWIRRQLWRLTFWAARL